jgi:hypothetical protein
MNLLAKYELEEIPFASERKRVKLLVKTKSWSRILEPAEAAQAPCFREHLHPFACSDANGICPTYQVAEHCWDPVGHAIVRYGYRFEGLIQARQREV